MPTYVFRNADTGEEWQEFMKIAEREEYLAANPHIHPIPTAPAIISGTGDAVNKTDKEFQSLLKNIKKKSGRGNTINV